jgi:luciferase family oxidoreductase group 1
LYPGRIDLGIGRAAGTSPNVARQLQRDRRQAPPDDFPAQLDELLALLNEPAAPRVSILGSSPQSAIWAAERGLPYVFADFINSEGAEITKLYRDRFRPSLSLAEPHTAVALWAICAQTDDEAMRLSLSVRMTLAMMMRGRLIVIPTVERAEQFFREQNISPLELTASRRFLTGSPETIRPAIDGVAESYGAQEVFLVNILHSHAARVRSYELLSPNLDLVPTSRIYSSHGHHQSLSQRELASCSHSA